jgi:hypothetical protein
VDDETQLLHPETVPGVTDFADGDLTGLTRLGRGPASRALTPGPAAQRDSGERAARRAVRR